MKKVLVEQLQLRRVWYIYIHIFIIIHQYFDLDIVIAITNIHVNVIICKVKHIYLHYASLGTIFDAA